MHVAISCVHTLEAFIDVYGSCEGECLESLGVASNLAGKLLPKKEKAYKKMLVFLMTLTWIQWDCPWTLS